MSRLRRVLLTLTIFLFAAPILASAGPAHSGSLKPDFCHVWSFTAGGPFNGAVTHNSRKNDMYQILCAAGGDTCWAWSFNTGNGGTILNAGLTAGNDWEWWVCAWASNAGKTKYQAIASIDGQDLRVAGRLSESVEVDLSSDEAPAGVRKMTRQLNEFARR